MKAESEESQSTKKGAEMGLGCLVLFATPFAAAGLLALFQGIKQLQAGKQKDGVILCLVGSLFTLVGFGLMAGGVYGMRLETERNKRKAAHPLEPWRWKEDWALGRADSQGRSSVVVAWIFAVVWNLISSSVFFALPQELAKGNKAVLIALIFPLIGAGLLAGAVYSTLQRRKYGQAVFKLLSNPGVIGGELAGLVEIPKKVIPQNGFKVQLQCVQKLTSGSGKNRSTRETPVWQDQRTVTQDLLAHQNDKTGIPVQFAIPSSAPASSADTCNPSIHWRLRVTADVPGVDLNETFEVPVFRTEASPAPTAEVLESTPRWEKPLEQFVPPAGSRVRVEALPTGGCLIRFPAARNAGCILTALFMSALFGGALAVLMFKKAPIIFAVVLGFILVLLLLCCLHMLLHSSRVKADMNGVHIRDSWFFFSHGKHYPRAELVDVHTHLGMQAGNKCYYDLRLRLASGRKINLGTSVPDAEHAAWLAAVIRQAVGLRPDESRNV